MDCAGRELGNIFVCHVREDPAVFNFGILSSGFIEVFAEAQKIVEHALGMCFGGLVIVFLGFSCRGFGLGLVCLGIQIDGSVGDFVEVGDNLRGLRCFGVQLAEVRGGDLERVEHEAGGFGVDGFIHQLMHDLSDGKLDGVGILEDGQSEVGTLAFFAEIDDDGTPILVVITIIFVAQGGRAALGSAGSDVLTTWCSE